MDPAEFLDGWCCCEGALARKARLYFRDREAAADAVQETFLRVYQKHESISNGDHLRRYAFLTLRNYYADFLRERSRELTYCSQCEPLEREAGYVAEKNVLIREVRDAFLSSSSKDQEVLQVFAYRSSLVDESRRTGVPVTTIRSREQSALERMRRKLRLDGAR